ncbi:hypothetical protein B0H19DRAFT_1110562 [Mycena capillaripes]|nr:hypothetical protein B0H19DRAFT_1110562 [Mycena capillaripes]
MEQGFSFPLDLEREIFETAAVRSRAMILTLLRVCRRVHAWLEPLLYRVIHAKHQHDTIISTVSSKPATFLQNAVRHVVLWPMDWNLEDSWNKTLLSNCPDIINLLIAREFKLYFIPLLNRMRVRKLYIIAPQSASEWARSTLKHQLFLSVTHLFFYQKEYEEPEPSTWNDWSQLAFLPALTHLALSESLSRGILPHVIAECLGLVLVATLFWSNMGGEREKATHLAQNPPVADPRVLVMVLSTFILPDWKIGAEGGDDFWVRADTFIVRKRRGEIESTCYILDETSQLSPELLPFS